MGKHRVLYVFCMMFLSCSVVSVHTGQKVHEIGSFNGGLVRIKASQRFELIHHQPLLPNQEVPTDLKSTYPGKEIDIYIDDEELCMAAIQFSSVIDSNGTGSMNATVETVPCAAERTVAPSFKQSRFRRQPLNRPESDKTGVKASKSPDELPLGWQLSRAELYRTMIGEKVGIWLKSMTTKLRSGLEGSTKSLLAVMLLVFGFQTVEAREIPKVNGQINEIYEDQFGRVFVIGEFTSVGETPARNIAVWKNGHWYSLGSGTDGVINDIEVTPGGGVVIVGEFRTAGVG